MTNLGFCIHISMARCLLGALLMAVELAAVQAADDLEQQMLVELSSMDCPGALVGVQVGSDEPQVFALGVADIDTKSPMRRDLHMRIASVTKLFVGTSILMLADEGKLSLDDPVSKYVEGVPEGDKITLRQLGNNTSGLFNSIENKDFQAAIIAEPTKKWQADEILQYAFAKPAYNPPGEKFRYSNTNAVLLDKVIEKVTGKSYEDFVEEQLIEPLKLKQTGFVSGAAVPSPTPSSYRNGYEDKWLGYGDTFYNLTGKGAAWSGAAGNMFSTVDDLLIVGKPLATGKFVSESSRKELTDWVPTGHDDIRYGFCLGERNDWIGHTGDLPGFSAFLGYFPVKDTTVVVLSNLSNNADGTSPAERLRDIVIEEMKLVDP